MSNLATNPVDLTNEEETQEWLNNIEVEYSYACYKEKDADFCFRLTCLCCFLILINNAVLKSSEV